MSKISQHDRLINAALHAIGGSVALIPIVFLITMRQEVGTAVAELRAAEAEHGALTQRTRETRAAHENALDQLRTTKTRLETLKSAIPKSAGEIDFMNHLSNLTNATGFQIRNFKPGAVVPQQFHQELVIHFTGEGPYSAFCLFLDGLQKLPRCYRIGNMNVVRQNREGQHYCVADYQLRLIFDLNHELAIKEASL